MIDALKVTPADYRRALARRTMERLADRKLARALEQASSNADRAQRLAALQIKLGL